MRKSRGAHAAHEIHDGDIVVLRAEEGEDLPVSQQTLAAGPDNT